MGRVCDPSSARSSCTLWAAGLRSGGSHPPADTALGSTACLGDAYQAAMARMEGPMHAGKSALNEWTAPEHGASTRGPDSVSTRSPDRYAHLTVLDRAR